MEAQQRLVAVDHPIAPDEAPVKGAAAVHLPLTGDEAVLLYVAINGDLRYSKEGILIFQIKSSLILSQRVTLSIKIRRLTYAIAQ